MRRLAQLFGAVVLLVVLLVPASAQGSFGFKPGSLEMTFTEMEAGTHPFEMSTTFEVNTKPFGADKQVPDGEFKSVIASLPEGLVGSANPVQRCSAADFSLRDPSTNGPLCSDASAVGVAAVAVSIGPIPDTYVNPLREGIEDPSLSPNPVLYSPVYMLEPSPGQAARLGFVALGVPVVLDVGVNPDPPYNVRVTSTAIVQSVLFFGIRLNVWGNPGDSAHDPVRGNCLNTNTGGSFGECSAEGAKPFLTLPRSCGPPLALRLLADSWQSPGDFIFAEAQTPTGVGACSKLNFAARIEAAPTTRAASSPTGLDFKLNVDDLGLTNPVGAALADIEKAVVTLPRGMTVNPSQAEGLEVCTEEQLGRETAFSAPGAGCPEASKIGTIEVENPLVEETLKGSLFIAKPYENLAGDSLIALYIVIKSPTLGVIFKQPARVEPDPKTGQLVTITEDMPQWPLGRVRLRLREGGRSPLISPPGCGIFQTSAELFPSSGGPPLTTKSAFKIISGPDGAPCPAGAPFGPGFTAGSLDAAAGRYSPFYMRLTRRDGEQDMTKLSFVLPPGIVPKLAGIPYCPEAAIARAQSRTGPHGGQEELDDPSCPAASLIGRTSAGAGVASQLTYVPGKLYLAGPYHGAPLSAVAVTPALAGPFDVGTVVVREALTLNSVTHRGEVDGSASDPIPHILKGIPLNLRELEVYADRPQFTLNPTNCASLDSRATIWGGGTALDPAADTPFGLTAPYQAVNCAKLGFRPRLAIKLRGGTRRGAHPALRAVVTPRPGDANFSRAVVTLPRSAFLDQGHIRTICTRVQFAAGPGNGALCPPGARYGFARAWSPLLDGPLSGPVFLRSSDNNLPDLVVALKGPPSAAIDIELSARIDSVKGGIRSTFTGIPDAPVSRFILDMQGGKKGLIVNSRHLCHKPKRNRAKANLRGQNGRFSKTRPRVIATACQKRRKAKRKRAKRSSGHLARASRAAIPR